MALPAGVTTATVIAGVPVTHTGAAVKAFVSIEPSAYLVHAATGTPLVDFLEELDISEGTAGQFILPHTDQAGFIDGSGAAYTNWYYTARVTYSTPSKAKTKAPKVKVFQLTTGQTTIDLDLLPEGAPALPYIAPSATVNAFMGRTGAVTLLDADLPERLSETELSATFATPAVVAAGDAGRRPLTYPANMPATSAGDFDRRLSLYNAKPSQFRRFRAKLGAAKAGTGLCRVSVGGDSIVAGESANPYGANAWPSRMRAAMVAAGTPSAGTGMVLTESGGTVRDSRWTGASGHYGGTANKGSLIQMTSGSCTFTSDVAGTVVDVYVSEASGGFTVTVDGGTPAAYTGAGGNAVALRTITGLANTTHTVVIAWTSGTVYVAGAAVRQTTGLLVNNFGIGGTTAAHWITAEPYQPANEMVTYGADLFILSLMTNDVLQSVSAADYKTAMQTLITQTKAVADVLLVAAVPGNSVNLAAHRTALYELADTNDLPVLDFTDRWGSYGTANGFGMMYDSWHPNANGYADLGIAAAAVLA